MCQHHRRPTVVRHAGARIDDRMVGVIGGAVLGDVGHRADLDGRIDGLHLAVIILEAHGVGPRIMRLPGRVGVVVRLPSCRRFRCRPPSI